MVKEFENETGVLRRPSMNANEEKDVFESRGSILHLRFSGGENGMSLRLYI